MMRTLRGSCNSYLYSNILIDAAAGIDYRKQGVVPGMIIITHEHCDHFAGLDDLDCDDIRASGFCAQVINGRKAAGLCAYIGLGQPKKKVARTVKDGERIEGDGLALRVLETPGHAKGAICLYEEEKKVLFSGDMVFPDMGLPRVDLPTSEPGALNESYHRLAALGVDEIYPGHGNAIREKGYVAKLLALITSSDG
jgi:hydroxyacylglutathione hydrolase